MHFWHGIFSIMFLSVAARVFIPYRAFEHADVYRLNYALAYGSFSPAFRVAVFLSYSAGALRLHHTQYQARRTLLGAYCVCVALRGTLRLWRYRTRGYGARHYSRIMDYQPTIISIGHCTCEAAAYTVRCSAFARVCAAACGVARPSGAFTWRDAVRATFAKIFRGPRDKTGVPSRAAFMPFLCQYHL